MAADGETTDDGEGEGGGAADLGMAMLPTYKLAKTATRHLTAEQRAAEKADWALLQASTTVRLKSHQTLGLQWFVLKRERQRMGGIIGDEMGLGKTFMIIAAMVINVLNRTLIMVPCSVLGQWREALQKFSLETVEITGPDPNVFMRNRPQGSPAIVFLTTHSTLQRKEMHGFFGNTSWDRLVVDEAHVMRNDRSLIYGNATRIKAVCRWALTATPIQNRIDDIVALGHFVNADDPEDARAVCANHMLRRTVKEVEAINPRFAPPPLISEYRVIALEKHERDVYDSIGSRRKGKGTKVTQMQLQRMACVDSNMALASMKRGGAAAGASRGRGKGRARGGQGAGGGHAASSKISWLRDDIKAQKPDVKSLVFCTWAYEIDAVGAALASVGVSWLVYDGSLDTAKREAVLNNFKLPGVSVLILQMVCGSVGLNLQHATRVYIMSPSWNPSMELQAIARTHRQGQEHTVTCTRLIARDTIEDHCMYIQKRKSDLVDAVTGDDLLRTRLKLSSSDLGFMAGGRGVEGLEDMMEEEGVSRPALSLSARKRRRADGDAPAPARRHPRVVASDDDDEDDDDEDAEPAAAAVAEPAAAAAAEPAAAAVAEPAAVAAAAAAEPAAAAAAAAEPAAADPQKQLKQRAKRAPRKKTPAAEKAQTTQKAQKKPPKMTAAELLTEAAKALMESMTC